MLKNIINTAISSWNVILIIVFIFLVLIFIRRVMLIIIKRFFYENETLRPLIPTFSRTLNVFIWLLGVLIALDSFGVSITPVIATLGIGGLAVGLALQDTLQNFFAGLHILFSQIARSGDYIKLDNGSDGYVVSIGWRETRIRTLPNNIIIIPNQKLAQMMVTNCYLPDKEMACLVQVGVSYDSDLEKVERITVEVGEEVLAKTVGGMPNFKPFIRYHTFSDFSINFTVILRVKEFTDQYLVTHEFIKALHKRYRSEGIEIPFPIRNVYVHGKVG